MITRHLTSCTITFNPFLKTSRTARIFASLLPPGARASVKVNTKVLPRTSTEQSWVEVVFTDGKKMRLETAKMGVKDVVEEVDRHSRMLGRAADLRG